MQRPDGIPEDWWRAATGAVNDFGGVEWRSSTQEFEYLRRALAAVYDRVREQQPGVVPGTEHRYIVFSGLPREFHPREDSVSALKEAEQFASDRCEHDEDHPPQTMMCVPVESLELAIVATYKGVTMRNLREAKLSDDPEPWN